MAAAVQHRCFLVPGLMSAGTADPHRCRPASQQHLDVSNETYWHITATHQSIDRFQTIFKIRLDFRHFQQVERRLKSLNLCDDLGHFLHATLALYS